MEVINYLGDRLGSGGIESFVTNASSGMKEMGIEYVVCVNYRTDNIYEKRLSENSAKVLYLSETDPGYSKKIWRFGRYVKKHKEAILYLHASTAGMYLHAFIARIMGVKKIVYHVHSTPDPMEGRLKKIKNKILNLFLNDIPKVRVACSKAAGRSIYGDNGYRVIHNGIDVNRFLFDQNKRKEVRECFGLEGRIVLGQVGRLSFQKNQKFTLDLLRDCLDKGLDVVAVLIGEGKDMCMLQEYAHINKLEPYVRFLAPSETIEMAYQGFDVFLFPSIYEGLGIVAIEAQVAGLPVLCSEDIAEEVCLTDFIYRLPLCDKAVWVERISKIIDDLPDRKKRTEAGRAACVKEGYSIDGMHRELFEIYKAVTG